MAEKMQSLGKMTTRQKVVAVVIVIVLLIIIWQVYGMFSGEAPAPEPVPASAAPTPSPAEPMRSSAPSSVPPTPTTAAKPSQLHIAGQPLTAREAELLRLQQETQTKYLAALNELQMLRLSREIAITNKDISTAKLDKVTAEKKIVDLLAPAPPPPPPPVIQPTEVRPVSTVPVAPLVLSEQEVNYAVVSVSQLQYRWSAVLNYRGSLLNVHVGDVLPPDGSRVISINKSGVTLRKGNVRKKLTLLPTI